MLKCHVAEWLINLKYSPSYVYLDWNCIKIKLLTHVWRRIHSRERKRNLSERHTRCNIKLGDQFQWDYTNLLILSLVKRLFWFQGYGLKYTFFEVLSSCFMWGAKYNVHQFMWELDISIICTKLYGQTLMWNFPHFPQYK